MQEKQKNVKPKNSQLRLTPQRMLILDLLKNDASHPSAEDIYRRARKRFPNISFKTVYNTLDTLKDNMMLRELHVDSKKKRYCRDPKPHHHIVCSECKKVVDVHLDFNTKLSEKYTEGFRITGSSITFYGTCPDCSANDRTGR